MNKDVCCVCLNDMSNDDIATFMDCNHKIHHECYLLLSIRAKYARNLICCLCRKQITRVVVNFDKGYQLFYNICH
jgi:hypothetical protein